MTVSIALNTSADSMTGEIKENSSIAALTVGSRSQGTTVILPYLGLNREVLLFYAASN